MESHEFRFINLEATLIMLHLRATTNQ